MTMSFCQQRNKPKKSNSRTGRPRPPWARTYCHPLPSQTSPNSSEHRPSSYRGNPTAGVRSLMNTMFSSLQHTTRLLPTQGSPLQDQQERSLDGPFLPQVRVRDQEQQNMRPPEASWTHTHLRAMRARWPLLTPPGGTRDTLKPRFLVRPIHPSMLRRHSWTKGDGVTGGQPAPDKLRNSRGRSTRPTHWHEPLNPATRAREGGLRPGTQTALRARQQKGLLFGKQAVWVPGGGLLLLFPFQTLSSHQQ